MRLIDADALKAWLKTIPLKDLSDGKGICRVIMEHDFAKAIKNMPAECIVDAVEVVRCGGCRYYRDSLDGYTCENEFWNAEYLVPTEPDDFCSYGELKEVTHEET